MIDAKPKKAPTLPSAGEDHPVTPHTTVTISTAITKDESKSRSKSRSKKRSPKARLHYDQVHEPRTVFWSRDDHGHRVRSRSPEPDKKRLVNHDAFGFFGPEHTDKPTIASKSTETPTVMITPPSPGEEVGAQHEEFLHMERARYLRSRLWLQERKRRARSELQVVASGELALPPLQSNERARVANERGNEEREKRRVQCVLRKETIEALEKGDGDGTSSRGE